MSGIDQTPEVTMADYVSMDTMDHSAFRAACKAMSEADRNRCKELANGLKAQGWQIERARAYAVKTVAGK